MQVIRLHLERVAVVRITVLWLIGLRANDRHGINLYWQRSTSSDVIDYKV
jgi:hypothetical protein